MLLTRFSDKTSLLLPTLGITTLLACTTALLPSSSMTAMAVTDTEPATISNSADEAAIRALLQSLIDAWNQGDGNAYASAFTDNADYVNFSGMHIKGRREIASQHQQLFDTVFKGSRLSLEVTNIRFLRPDVALMHVVGGIKDAGQFKTTPERNLYQTVVATKHNGEWRFQAIQVTRIQPINASQNPNTTINTQIQNMNWRLIEWQLSGQSIPLLPQNPITIQFEGNRLDGSTGCNSYSSTYRLQNYSFQLTGDIITTKIGCVSEIANQETQYLAALKAAEQLRIDAQNRLVIRYTNSLGEGTLIFFLQAPE